MYNLLADEGSIDFSPIVLCDALVDSTEASDLPIVYQQKKRAVAGDFKGRSNATGRMVKWNGETDTNARHD